jgi:hypothetical protein
MKNIVALLKTERDKVAWQLKGRNSTLAAFAGESYQQNLQDRTHKEDSI